MRLFFLFLTVSMLSIFTVNAQETKKVVKQKKVVIVEKSKDGKMIRKEIITDGNEDIEIELEDFNVDSLIEVLIKELDEEEIQTGEKKRRIMVKTHDGKTIKKDYDNQNIEVDVDASSGEKKVIITTTKDGKKEVMEWIGQEGDEMPAEFEVEVDESWVDVEELPQPTVSMGIAISESVKIDAILEGSAAYEAGLRKDDIIKKVDSQIIYSHRGLLEHLTSYKSGDTVLVSYERGGKSSSTKLTLKERE